MTRARRLPPEERRQALIDATLPLLLEHGPGVTTRQVADAAGVAEGTIYRAFNSLEDLIHAAVTDAFTHDDLDETLLAIAPDADLRGTVTAVVSVIAERVLRLRGLVSLFHGQGHDPHTPAADAAEAGPLRCSRPDPREIHERIATSVADVLARHAGELRTTPAHAASALLSLTFGALHPMAGHPDLVDPDAVADLLLHGIAKDA